MCAEKARRKPQSSIRRCLFLGVAALLWLGLLGLAVESYSRVRRLWIRHRNPYVLAAFQQGEWQPPAARSPQEPQTAVPKNSGPRGSAPPEQSSPPPAGSRQVPQSEQAARIHALRVPPPLDGENDEAVLEAWRRQAERFVETPEDKRTGAALRLQKLVLTFDGDTRLLACYGDKQQSAYSVIHDFLLGRTLQEAHQVLPVPSLRDALEPFEKAVRRTLNSQKPLAVHAMGRGTDSKPQFMLPVHGTAGEKVLVFLHTDARQDRWEEHGFRMKKNFKVDENFSTNNFGFRGPHVVVPKPEDVVRIVCVGGSTTEGGSTDESTYPAQLQHILRERLDTERVEVVNAGISGMGSASERKRFHDYLELGPDIIVEYNFVNDAETVLMRWAEPSGFTARLVRASAFLNTHWNRFSLPARQVVAGTVRKVVVQNLEAMAAEARKHDVCMAVCSFAYPKPDCLNATELDFYRLNAEEGWLGSQFTFETYCWLVRIYNQCVRELCQEQDLLFVPVAEEITAGTAVFADICHMLDGGLGMKAAIVATYLQERVERLLAEKAHD